MYPVKSCPPSLRWLNRHSSRALSALALLTLLLSPAAAQTQAPPARTLSVTGSADLQVAPDAALVSMGVVTESASAAAALKDNSAALAKVLDVVRSAGVEAKDMQTRGLSLEPRYDNLNKPNSADRPRIVGYSAVNLVTLRLRDLSKIGDLLDKIATAGANRIDSISFVVSNQDKLLDQARQQAVANAKERADLYAHAGGFALGKIMTLTEETGPMPRPVVMMRAAAAPAAAVPVEAGETTLTVRVHVTWSLAD